MERSLVQENVVRGQYVRGFVRFKHRTLSSLPCTVLAHARSVCVSVSARSMGVSMSQFFLLRLAYAVHRHFEM